MEIKISYTANYVVNEILLIAVKLFLAILATFVVFYVFSIKLSLLPQDISAFFIAPYLLLTIALILYFSKKSFIRRVVCESNRITTHNMFGRIYERDLTVYSLRPNYLINLDNNQLKEFKLEVIDKKTGEIVDYIFDHFPEQPYREILNYYKLSVQGLEPRKKQALPLSRLQRSNRNTAMTLLMLPSVLLLIGAYVCLIEQDNFIIGLPCAAFGGIGIFLSIYNIRMTAKRK